MGKNTNQLPKKSILSAQIDLAKFSPATEDEKKQQDVMSESTTFFKDGMLSIVFFPAATKAS